MVMHLPRWMAHARRVKTVVMPMYVPRWMAHTGAMSMTRRHVPVARRLEASVWAAVPVDAIGRAARLVFPIARSIPAITSDVMLDVALPAAVVLLLSGHDRTGGQGCAECDQGEDHRHAHCRFLLQARLDLRTHAMNPT
jgi:hypothetical protein